MKADAGDAKPIDEGPRPPSDAPASSVAKLTKKAVEVIRFVKDAADIAAESPISSAVQSALAGVSGLSTNAPDVSGFLKRSRALPVGAPVARKRRVVVAKKPAKKELAVDRSNELRYCMLELASAFSVSLETLVEYAKEDYLESLWITKYDPLLDANDEEDRESLVRDIAILIDMLPLIKSKSQQDWMTKMIWGVEEELKESSVGYERLAKPALAG